MYKLEKRPKKSICDEENIINIRNISEKHTKVSLLGVIIQKQSVKRCSTNISGTSCSQGVLGFTLRDSICDWINGSYWGALSNVRSVASQFNIGDCVVVLNARLKFKEKGSYEERFMVRTPSDYHLLLRDWNGSIMQYALPDKLYSTCLKSSLVCPAAYHISLHQIVQTIYFKKLRKDETSLNWKSHETASEFTFFAVVSEVKHPKTLITPQRKLKCEELTQSLGRNGRIVSKSQSTQSAESFQKVMQLCEVLLYDDSCNCLPLVLWNEEWIHIALTTFIPNSTVLSIVNCPVRYDQYRRGAVASPNSKTLIIISPDCTEANRLSQLCKHQAQSINILKGDQSQFSVKNVDERLLQPLPLGYKTVQPEIYKVPLTSIHNILTVRDIKEGKVVAGYACSFALFTKIDLDCTNTQYLITLQCSNCHGHLRLCDPPADYDITAPGKQINPNIKNMFAMCTTPGCPTNGQRLSWFDKQHVNMEYGTIVHLSDHTGTYSRCLLASVAMEKLLGYNVEEFLQLPMEKRVRLKWELCLRRFKIYFWTEQISYNNPLPLIVIIGVEKPNAFEVMHSLKLNK
ncbi:Meiosis-specific with OB domain-containing protein [Schistosoma japonicum]|nr:Meiosis-specific with OB domain-containing protein [Schistosoma japonicum]